MSLPRTSMLRSITQLTLCAILATTARLRPSTAAVPRCVLTGGKAHIFKKQGSPLVFTKAVKSINGSKPGLGDVVDVVDGAGDLIGWGVYNPHSMYRVRLLATTEPELLADRDIGAVLRHRIATAAQLRAACLLPSEKDTAYRLVNSEGDRISGLTVDVFGGIAVAVVSALWIEQWRDEVVSALQALPSVTQVVWRRSDGRLQQDGWDKVRSKHDKDEGKSEDAELGEAEPTAAEQAEAAALLAEKQQKVEILESGLRFLVAPALGQKSGFYCDQRDNRRLLADMCRGKTVLDLFCYSGGFSISAAANGASSSLGVDSSAYALEVARENARINGVHETVEFLQADVHRFLQGDDAGNNTGGKSSGGGVKDQYDVVICDPPKLAPSVKDLKRASKKYLQLNRGAIRATKPGGLLLSCTCSAAMTQSGDFVRILHMAAQAEGRTLTLLRTSGAAPDHVIHPGVPESAYLTAVLAHVA